MIAHQSRTAAEWFQEAAHCHLEGHQACAWCGTGYCVYKRERGNRLEYHCSTCDFYVSHDSITDTFFMAPGQEESLLESSTVC